MILKQCFLTDNNCFKNAQRITNDAPKGIVIHSTGANNPQLKRYVQPLLADAHYDDIISNIGKNLSNNDWNRPLPDGISKCVHAFIGLNEKGIVETYQTLPYNIACWGVGSGSKGSYNRNPNARIQFEICEDGLTDSKYFNAVMKEAQEFCAYLCQRYGFGVDKICSHYEAYLAGYGSGHIDPHHWLTRFGKDMDWFRAEVQKIIDKEKAAMEEIKKELETIRYEFGLLKLEFGNLTTIYNYVDEMPEWAKPTILKLYNKGYLKGDENNNLNLDMNMIRMLVINDRAGIYD